MLVHKDFKKISKRIQSYISRYISKNSAKGIVIGLSGGLDSSVVVKLAVNALGPSKVLGIVIPSDVTPKEDVQHAIDLAQSLGIKYHIIDIGILLEKYSTVLPMDKKAMGNLTARIRMNILYYFANISGYIVAGTSDKSELLIGYFTKFGDGASDILPIADLYKTQVRALAKYLEIPQMITEKKSSPQLWAGHVAEEEIGIDYQRMDPLLYLLVEKKLRPTEAAKKLGVPIRMVRKIKEMVETSVHKRQTPFIAQTRN